MDMQADAIARVANALEVALPLLEKIADDVREFTRVQSEAFELMKSREDEMRRVMGTQGPQIDREMDVL